MTREELMTQVRAIQERHATLAAAPKDGGDGIGAPPTFEETTVLLLDKLIATADAFGIQTDPDDWTQTAPGRFERVDGDVTFVFDQHLGMSVESEHRSTGIEIHDAADVAPALAEIARPEPIPETASDIAE